jgi:hypothetical protein
MNRPDAISGFVLTPDCPSEAILDAFELKESISPAQTTHIDHCPVCAARLEERKSAFAALDREEIVRTLHIKTAGREERRPLFGRAIAALSFAAALAVGAILFLRPPAEVRTKGSVGLEVFVERDGLVQRAVGGGEFKPGDRLRFEVDLPDPAHILILGVEADGSLYNTYPATASVATALKMNQGADQILPGAVELDEKLGREILHLVACERSFNSAEVKNRGSDLVLPEGCIAAPFVLKKVD